MLIISIPMQYLHAIGTFQGILLAVMLLFGARVSDTARLLGTWCLFLAFYFCSPLIVIHANNTILANLVGWGYFIPASFGAFLYLYCRSAIAQTPLNIRDFVHSIPLLICLLLNLDFLLSPAADKIYTANNALHNRDTLLLTQLIMFIQAFVYLGLSVRLIARCKRQADNLLSNFNPNIFNWLWLLISLYGGMWIAEIIGLIMGAGYAMALVSDLMAFILIYSVSMAQWRDPNLFTINKLSTLAVGKDAIKPKTEFFDSETREKLLENVMQVMKDEQLYLKTDLSLDLLAKSTALSSHHLSEILNQQAKKNFYQFVNEYRINFVCEQIASEPESKLLELAMSSGFSSKSTFNAVFKQIKGLTPTQYRKSIKSN